MDIENISIFDWARLAAFIDGEGSITIGKQADKRRKRGYRYFITISVYNTNRKLMDWLQKTFGLGVWSRHDGDLKHKKSYKAYATRQQAEVILKNIKPWLIIKGELADVALTLQLTMGSGGTEVTDDDLDFREYLWKKARALNQRGGTQN